MKSVFCLTLALSLSACGGGGGGSTTTGNTTKPASSSSSTATGLPSGSVTNKDGKLEILGNNNTATANYSDKKNEISVSGDGNIIYIQTNTSALDIIGNGNTIEVSNGVTIDKCNILGDNNQAIKPTGTTIACSLLGKDNTGFN